jgi:pimeloyl-ACP methyl ester carboxylesterase
MSELVFVDDHAGHDLAVRRTTENGASASHRPVIIVPGYGMNSFVFGFHPAERSLEGTLAHHGLVVYSADLRGQGKSRSHTSDDAYGMAELAIDDVSAVIEAVCAREKCDRVDLVGCSLGTSLAFGYLAHRGASRVGSFVSLGGLVRWVEIAPALRVAFSSPALVAKVKMKNTRELARHALPIVTRVFPRLLSLYVNASSSDLSAVDDLVQTVEDPHAGINREIAEWIARRDLILRGVNVSVAIESMHVPLLCVVAKEDGIVPALTARDVYDRIASKDKELLEIGGDPAHPIAHADLFLSKGAEARVFDPIARFLLAR